MDTLYIILGWFLPPILLICGMEYYTYRRAKSNKDDYVLECATIPIYLGLVVIGPLGVFFMMVVGLITLKESYQDLIRISFKEPQKPKDPRKPKPQVAHKPKKPRKKAKRTQTPIEAELASQLLN